MHGGLLERAVKLCAGGALVRALGFGMRVWLARAVPEESLGMYEMSAQLGALLLSPLVSGLPQAASRVTAQCLGRGDARGAELAGRAARRMAGWGAGVLGLACLLLAPLIARWMGDARLAAPLAMLLPSAAPLAVAAVSYGCMYARGSTLPASLQLSEQSVRMLTAFLLLAALGGMGPAADASLLAAAQTAGAVAALALCRGAERSDDLCAGRPPRGLYRALLAIAWPISLGRMGAAGLRSVSQLLLPGRLAQAGLSRAAAMSGYGVLSGMVMPTVFLPFMFTGPLATLAMPRMAAAVSARARRRLARRTLGMAGAAGLAAWAALWALGPWVGIRVFGSAEAGALMRFMAPLAALGSMAQTMGALLQGLGRERASMRAMLAGSAATTLLTWALCARPELGIRGFGLAMMLGQGLTLTVQTLLLARGLLAESTVDTI